MNTIEIKYDVRRIRNTFSRISRYISTRAESIAVGIIINDVKELTFSGVDYAGKAFHEYAESYKPIRQKQGLQVAYVDHKVENIMVESVFWDGKSVTVPDSQQGKAHGTMYKWGREWLYAGAPQVKKIESRLTNDIENL